MNKRNPDRNRVLSYILGQRGTVELTEKLSDLDRVIAKFRASHVDILAISGGDGTINHTLSTLCRHYGDEPLPRIALLRGGTINVLADNLKIKGNPEEVLVRLLESYSGGGELRTRHIPTLRVDGRIGFLLATGVAPKFLERFYRNKTGAFGAFFLVVRIYLEWIFARPSYEHLVTARQEILQSGALKFVLQRCIGTFCSTLEKMPLRVPLFQLPRASTRPSFQVVAFDIPSRQLPWRLPFAMLHRGTGTRLGRLNFLSEALTIKLDNPFPYTLDGELYQTTTGKLEVSIGPTLEFVLL